MNLDERNNLIALVNDAGEYQSLLGMDYSEGGEVEDEPPDDGEQVQEFAEGGEVVGDPLFDDLQKRQAAANAYTNPIINQPAVGPAPVGQQPVSVPKTLSTPPLPTALSTMQQPQGSPTTAGFAPVTTGAATTLSASDMLSNIPTFASTARTLPTINIAQTPTLEKPVLRAEKDLPKPVINLAPPDILQKYGGTPISFDRPTDVAAYLTPDGLSKVTGTTTGTTTAGGYTAPAEMKTPGGYTYTNYQSFSPENVSGSKAQVTELFAGATKQQQSEADAIRQEYNKAVATGNWGLAGQLNGILLEQEADVARSRTDFTNASKYFTGVGGAYELPTGYQTRREGDYFKQQGITGYTGLDIGSIGFTPETKADPFTQALSQQQKEYNTANSVYNELSKQFGATSDIAKNYFSNVVTPQKEQYEQINKMAGDVGKANLYGTITGAAGYKDFSPLKLAEIRNEAQTTAAFKPTIDAYQTNVNKLTAARDQADKLGLGGYASQLNQLLDKENSRLEQARGARQSAIDQAQPDPMRDLILGKQMAAQKITGFSGVDLPDQDYSKLNAAQAFDPVIQRQNADYQAALGTYNQLKSLYGDKADITRNFMNDVVSPQKQELDQATLMRDNANTALKAINTNYLTYKTPAIKIDARTTEDGIRNAFKLSYDNIDKSVLAIDKIIQNHADKTGVSYYSDALRDKINKVNDQRGKIDADINMYINKIPGRAKGSPPEGEISDPVAKMVAQQSRSKDQGMDSKSKAMLKKFAGGGEAVASSSPSIPETGESKKNARTMTPNPALNMEPYEAMYKVQDTNFKNRKYASDVYSALLPELMRAHFPEYIAFSPATVTTKKPTSARSSGEYDPFRRTIAMDSDGMNSMLMEPQGKYGNIGIGDNTTTDETLNALRTLLHESMHARMNPGPKQRRGKDHPAEQLKKQMSGDRYDEMIREIRISGLPSVGDETNPYDIINEYFSTATPVRQMASKNMETRRTRNELKEVNRLAKKYPELEKMRADWERPELFFKD